MNANVTALLNSTYDTYEKAEAVAFALIAEGYTNVRVRKIGSGLNAVYCLGLAVSR